MKRIAWNCLRVYCLLFTTALMFFGLRKIGKPIDAVGPLLFAPVFVYLLLGLIGFKRRFLKLFWGYSLFFSFVLVISGAINIRGVKDGLFLLVTAPLLVFFVAEAKVKVVGLIKVLKEKREAEKNIKEEEVIADGRLIDESKRKFLKIAAGTSLATVAMYFLNRQKAGAAFFGSIPGPGTVAIKDSTGTKVDIAQKQPLDGYSISDIDTSGSTQYFGFMNKDGAWYILQANADNSIRYARGSSGYTTPTTGAWATRASQSYGIFSEVF